MKTSSFRIISLILATVFIFSLPESGFGQNKLMGEIEITGRTLPGSENFVTVNGERVSSGRTIMSPAEISTSAGTTAKITLPKTGTILITPNSNLKLSFIESSISGDLTAGEIIVETVPGTTLSIQTADGATTLPVVNQANIVKISFNGGASRINTLVGTAMFNTVQISAGEYFPVPEKEDPKTTAKSSKGNNNFVLFALIGAAAAAALVGLSVASGGNESTPVSPFR